MAKRYDMLCLAGTVGLVLVLTSGCTRSIQANSGSKSFEQGGKRPAPMQTAAKPGTSSSGSIGSEPMRPSSGARSETGGGREFRGSDFKDETARSTDGGPQGSSSEPSVPIPSLSTMDSGPSLTPGKNSDEQPVPNDIMVAKTEPADAARRRVEEMQQEQLATAAAGLEDVFFGFDTWQISNEGKQALMTDAEWLKTNGNKTVLIEGHCDERGTLAYNLVLGEKRAKAVQKYLVELGVPSDRLKVVSYGKERPFCKGHEETCYQQNRRGHIVLRPE